MNAEVLSRIPVNVGAVQVQQSLASNLPTINLQIQAQNPELATVIMLLKDKKALHGTAIAHGLRRFFLKDGILCREYVDSSSNTKHIRQVVLSDLREMILKHLYGYSGHLGLCKTMKRVKVRYYWPGYGNDIEKWIHECDECQQCYPPPRNPLAPLGTIKTHYPFEMIAWDIMGPLPVSERGHHQYILVVTNVFTKCVEAFPLHDTVSTTLAEILVDVVISFYGVPKNVHSDQGANFSSSVIQSVYNLLKIDQMRTSAYHPMGNGQVKRFNRTIEAMPSKIMKESQRDWDWHLNEALLAYKTAIHEITGFSPHRLNFGRSL